MASAVAIAGAFDWMVASRVPVINISLSGQPNLLIARAVERNAPTRRRAGERPPWQTVISPPGLSRRLSRR